MIKKFSLAILALTWLTTARAAEVSQQQAASIAQEKVAGDVESVKAVEYNGEKAYYIVEFRQGGWVMVSADDKAKPIIGYSPTDRWPSEADMPENFRGMMACYAEDLVQIKHVSRVRHAEWEPEARGAKARALASSDSELKVPLIKVNWAQGNPYNFFCPSNANGKAVVGCVAVGMAQAMSVAQWPERPVGNHGYTSAVYGSLYIDYDKEDAYDWNAILTGANQNLNVARLLWHCGVSINMDYSPSGSGTQSSYIPTALQRNFSYPASVKYYTRDNYDGDWAELLLNELRDGRAVIYSGHDSKGNYGHCFNIDAYDGDFFHVNWGWGASYNQDSWFSIEALNDPRMQMNYDSYHGAVIGVRAPSPYPSNITLSALEVQAGQPAGTFVADVEVESEAVDPVYKWELKGKYSARQHKYLEAPFEVVDNQLLTTKVLSEGTETVTMTVTNTQNGHSKERTFTIIVTDGPVAVKETKSETVSTRYFSPSGIEMPSPRRGLNIIRMQQADGTSKVVKRFIK